MDERGNVLIIIGVAILLIILASVALPVLMYTFEPANIIVRIILVFVIVAMVRGYLGNGILMLLVSGILIYFLVIKWWWLSSSVWFFTVMLSFGVVSIFVWGTSKIIPAH